MYINMIFRTNERVKVLKKIKSAILFLLSLVLSACTLNMKVDELLSPPKLTQQQDAIFTALQKAVGKNIKLKYPRMGDQRSAFVIANLDEEPSDEAIVFYELQTSDNSAGLLRVNILDQKDDKWYSAFDFGGIGSEVDEVAFSNLGTIGDTKIIIGYSALNQMQKSLSVMTYKNSSLTELMSGAAYSYMKVLDLNLDGTDELFVLHQDSTTQTAKATLYQTNNTGVFYKVTETDNIESVAEYTNISAGYAEKGLYGMFIDYSKGANQHGTEFLYYKGNRLINPIKETNQALNTSRISNNLNAVVASKDIDGDGIVEIPATVPFPGYGTLTKQEQFSATIWYNMSTGNLVSKYYSYYSVKNNYIFVFPERWRDVVSASINSELNEITFEKADRTPPKPESNHNTSPQNALLKIKTLDISILGDDFIDKENDLVENNYIYIGKNRGKSYYIWLGEQDNNMLLSKQDFITNFIVIKD